MDRAELRLRRAWAAGFFPYAMLYRDEQGAASDAWRKFQRLWARPQITYIKLKEAENG